jgi:hypothetical protein
MVQEFRFIWKLWFSISEVAVPFVHSSSYVIQAEVTQRLSIATEAANRSATVQSHEDLARKLKVIYCFSCHIFV